MDIENEKLFYHLVQQHKNDFVGCIKHFYGDDYENNTEARLAVKYLDIAVGELSGSLAYKVIYCDGKSLYESDKTTPLEKADTLEIAMADGQTSVAAFAQYYTGMLLCINRDGQVLHDKSRRI